MSKPNSVAPYVGAAVTTAGVIGAGYYAYHLHQKKKTKLPDDNEWKEVGYLKCLSIYPIKACAPVVTNQGVCSSLGMRDGWLRDRELMVVNAKDNHFITARAYPELLRVQPSVKKAILTLTNPEMEPIDVNLAEVVLTQKPFQATVWTSPVPVYDCGDEVSKWFTKLLNRPGEKYRLVYSALKKSRLRAEKPKVFTKWRDSDTGFFTDEMSYNLINESSVEDLNKHLKTTKVTHVNFRPNFLLSGDIAPYDEDNWKFIKIGGNIFEVIKPCTRCVLTTIDPETGTRYMEVLDTLKGYRLAEDPEVLKATGNSPRLGLQIALRSEPDKTVSINDPIYVAY